MKIYLLNFFSFNFFVFIIILFPFVFFHVSLSPFSSCYPSSFSSFSSSLPSSSSSLSLHRSKPSTPLVSLRSSTAAKPRISIPRGRLKTASPHCVCASTLIEVFFHLRQLRNHLPIAFRTSSKELFILLVLAVVPLALNGTTS